MILFIVLLSVLLIWLFIKYMTLVICDKKVCVAFDLLHAQIIKRYDLILNALNNVANSNLAEETRILIKKALEFSVQQEGRDRIIRFANAIFDNSKKLSLTLEEDNEFEFAKTQYNDFAKQLRHYIDVFPTSFMARVSLIITKDYLK